MVSDYVSHETLADISIEWLLRPLDHEPPPHVRTVLEQQIKEALLVRQKREIGRKETVMSPSPGLRFYRIEVYAGAGDEGRI